MSFAVVISVMFMEKQKFKYERLNRRCLRDSSNPLELSENAFIKYFRLNKAAFTMVLEDITPHMEKTSIPPILKLAAVLRYLGQGSAQQMIAKDSHIALGRSTVSKVLSSMLNVLENHICPNWKSFESTDEEKVNSKMHFYTKYKIPGVIGCVDGTHIRIKRPSKHGYLYLNRKGYYSINAMIVCDYKMNIIAVNARNRGSSHDSFIWKLSSERRYLLSKYQNGDRSSWLLGDSGYGLEPFLMTPYRDPSPGTIEHIFNQRHASARNLVERVIGVLKSRFRCLLDKMSYKPSKAVQIINVCCALHNICRYYNVQQNDLQYRTVGEINLSYNENDNENRRLITEASRIRNEIARNLN